MKTPFVKKFMFPVNELYITFIIFNTYEDMYEFYENYLPFDSESDKNRDFRAIFVPFHSISYKKSDMGIVNKYIGSVLINYKDFLEMKIVAHEVYHAVFHYLRVLYDYTLPDINNSYLFYDREEDIIHTMLKLQIEVVKIINEFYLVK